MGRFIDLSGSEFHRLTAVAPCGRANKQVVWFCKCKCGRIVQVRSSSLRNGTTKSCGCLRVDRLAENRYRLGSLSHGLSKQVEYRLYFSMRARCERKTERNYKYYGGRGIRVCNRWRHGENGKTGFECFFADMGQRPTPGHSIERLDNDGNYSPDNCAWRTQQDQCRNTRRNHYLTFRGTTLCLQAWSERIGVGAPTIRRRLKLGWSVAKALTTKVPA